MTQIELIMINQEKKNMLQESFTFHLSTHIIHCSGVFVANTVQI